MTEFRAERLWWHAEAVRHVPGDVAEIGVYSGASAYLLAKAFEGTGKRLHLFDTFAGFPAIGAHETGEFGELAWSLDELRVFLDGLPITFWSGRIEDYQETPGPLALVHVDCDLESCYRAALPKFWPAIAPGGVLVLDDYGFGRWPGASAAVHEYFDGTPWRIEGMRGDNWDAEVKRGGDWSFVQGIVRKCR